MLTASDEIKAHRKAIVDERKNAPAAATDNQNRDQSYNTTIDSSDAILIGKTSFFYSVLCFHFLQKVSKIFLKLSSNPQLRTQMTTRTIRTGRTCLSLRMPRRPTKMITIPMKTLYRWREMTTTRTVITVATATVLAAGSRGIGPILAPTLDRGAVTDFDGSAHAE